MTEEIVDYAMPLIKIERFAKEIHSMCLEHRYEEARQEAMLLGVEARLLQHTLSIMKESYADTNKT